MRPIGTEEEVGAVRSIDELRAEHEGIKVMLGVVEAICARIESGGAVDSDDIPRIVEFFSVFADRCHHTKEEDLLFPALEAAGAPREGGPIGVMLEEHAQARALIRAMRDALSGLDDNSAGALTAFAPSALAYKALLEQHSEKENDILFAAAERVLPSDRDDELFEGFAEIERERIGVGKHEEFHALLDALSAKYL